MDPLFDTAGFCVNVGAGGACGNGGPGINVDDTTAGAGGIVVVVVGGVGGGGAVGAAAVAVLDGSGGDGAAISGAGEGNNGATFGDTGAEVSGRMDGVLDALTDFDIFCLVFDLDWSILGGNGNDATSSHSRTATVSRLRTKAFSAAINFSLVSSTCCRSGVGTLAGSMSPVTAF